MLMIHHPPSTRTNNHIINIKIVEKTADSDTHLSNFKFQAVCVSFLSHKTIQLHTNPRRHPKKRKKKPTTTTTT